MSKAYNNLYENSISIDFNQCEHALMPLNNATCYRIDEAIFDKN